MMVIGVGCGPGMLTQEAIREIMRARRIYGSRRAVEMVKEFIPQGCEIQGIEDYSKARSLPEDAVLLSTGDPMLAGLGFTGAKVVPGISSMQVAFARLCLPLAGAIAVSAHGRAHDTAVDETIDELKRGKPVFIIADPGFDVKELARRMLLNGLDCSIAVCEDLGYENERVAVGTAGSLPEIRSRLFSVVAWRGSTI